MMPEDLLIRLLQPFLLFLSLAGGLVEAKAPVPFGKLFQLEFVEC
jgi:hypothetical protein